MTIRDELIALKDGGIIRAEAVVEWARKHAKSALHASIEWDDSAAAEQYRIWQVRRLIAIHVIDENGDRKFVSLSIDRVGVGGYREIEDVCADPDMSSVMLADALGELRRVRSKYNRLKALASVWHEADKVEEKYRRTSKNVNAANAA